ncbi:hypothetical protein R3P38DRAFT_3269908 [Favolaschia claudopus]|uniref:F-box domain-containing protein n=1 Tax=Favolaschia claudopus TaxID=2862362 RepID=A0AAW0BHC8_9AGAR
MFSSDVWHSECINCKDHESLGRNALRKRWGAHCAACGDARIMGGFERPCIDSDVLEIEQDIFLYESTAESRTRESRTLQNKLASISCLPSEILAEIFVHCVPSSIGRLRSDLQWMNPIRVCSYWRSVALACPDFWTTLMFWRPNSISVSLLRSRKAPLVARVDLDEDPNLFPEIILLEHAPRLRTFEIYSSQPENLAPFLAVLEYAGPAPLLIDVCIVNDGLRGLWLPGNLFGRAEIVETRKRGIQLGRLHLESCAFPWDSMWYSRLTQLELSNILTPQLPTMDAFLSVLRTSPGLQILTVTGRCPSYSSSSSPSHDAIVHLPHLTSLTLSGSALACSGLLDYLALPLLVSIDISCSIPAKRPPREINAVQDRLVTQLTQNLPPNWHDTLHVNYERSFQYSLSNSTRSTCRRSLWFRSGFMIEEWPSLLRITDIIGSCLDLSNITTLDLCDMPQVSVPRTHDPNVILRFHSCLSLWDDMGGALPCLTVLHLRSSFIGTLLEFLIAQAMLLIGVSHYRSPFHATTRGYPAFRDPDTVFEHAWPTLRCIVLDDINIDVPRNPAGTTRGELMRTLLWARRIGGAPIQQLEFGDSSDVDEDQVAKFVFFSDVKWDGEHYSMHYPSNDSDEEALRDYAIAIFTQMYHSPETETDRVSIRDPLYARALSMAEAIASTSTIVNKKEST